MSFLGVCLDYVYLEMLIYALLSKLMKTLNGYVLRLSFYLCHFFMVKFIADRLDVEILKMTSKFNIRSLLVIFKSQLIVRK